MTGRLVGLDGAPLRTPEQASADLQAKLNAWVCESVSLCFGRTLLRAHLGVDQPEMIYALPIPGDMPADMEKAAFHLWVRLLAEMHVEYLPGALEPVVPDGSIAMQPGYRATRFCRWTAPRKTDIPG